MNALITIADIRLVREVGEINLARVNCYIDEAQRYDVVPSIGIETFELVLSGSDAAHILLRDGGTYTANGRKYECEGLKKTLSYYSYKRIVLNNPANVTSFGVVQKVSENSTPLANADLRRISNEAEACGKAALESCMDYMANNTILFPEVQRVLKPRTSGVQFKAIGN